MLAFALAGEPDDDGNTAAKAQPAPKTAAKKPDAEPEGFDALLHTIGKAPKGEQAARGKAVKKALGLKEDATADDARAAYSKSTNAIKAAAAMAALGADDA